MARFGVADLGGALRGLQQGTQGQVAAANIRRQREERKRAQTKALIGLAGAAAGGLGVVGAGGLAGLSQGAAIGQAVGGAATGRLDLGEVVGGLQAAERFQPKSTTFEPGEGGAFNRVVRQGDRILSTEPVAAEQVPRSLGARSLVRSFIDKGKGLDEAVGLVGATERFQGLTDIARDEGRSHLAGQDLQRGLLIQDRGKLKKSLDKGDFGDLAEFGTPQQVNALNAHLRNLGVEDARFVDAVRRARGGAGGRSENVLQRELRDTPEELGFETVAPVAEAEALDIGGVRHNQLVDEASSVALTQQLKIYADIPRPSQFTTNTMQTRAEDRLQKDSHDTLVQFLLENPDASKDDQRLIINNIAGGLNNTSSGIIPKETSDKVFASVFKSANAQVAGMREEAPAATATATELAEPFTLTERIRGTIRGIPGLEGAGVIFDHISQALQGGDTAAAKEEISKLPPDQKKKVKQALGL